jgi:MFS family permease
LSPGGSIHVQPASVRVVSTTAAAETPRRAHQAFSSLRQPGYGAYLFGSMLAMMADSVEHVISYWMIFEKFHSPALGGYAVISHWLPFLLFSIYSGALADRFDPRRIIQIGMMLFMLCSLAWGVLFLTDTLEIWHAVAIFSVHGIAGVLWTPASQLLIHAIVGREQIHSAVRLMATSRVLGLVAGPAVGGAMLLVCGAAPGILINVLFYLPLTLWLWRAPFGSGHTQEPRAASQGGRGLVGVAATVREIAGNRVVVSMTLVAGVSSFVIGNAYQAQMPEFAADLGHVDADMSYSMLLAANAAGALVAGITLESFGILQARLRTAFVLVILWSICIGGFAVSGNYPLSLGLLFLAGFFNLAFGSMSQTLVQLHAPSAVRGRVLGLYSMCSNGMRAFSGVTVGMGGSLIGIHRSLALSALVLFVITMGLFTFATRSQSARTAE